MLNTVWLLLILGGVVTALFTGNVSRLGPALTDSAAASVKLAFGLLGIMAFWLGLMRIAEESGLLKKITTLISPVLRLIFPRIPSDHPSLSTMAMNLAANMLGLGNAATPIGIKAMQELDSLNKDPGTATDEMCMFLALNTAGIQFLPTAAIALLASGGAKDPTVVVLPSILAGLTATIAAVFAAKAMSKLKRFRIKEPDKP